MKILARYALAFSAGTAAVSLAACGGSQPPIDAPGALLPSHAFTPPRLNSIATGAKDSYRVLYSFAWGTADGSQPAAGLIDVNGTLYGTTQIGGSGCDSYGPGCGTVYSISTTGLEKVLHRFLHHPNHVYTDSLTLNPNSGHSIAEFSTS